MINHTPIEDPELEDIEDEQDIEMPSHRSALYGHRFRITDNPDGDNSDSDNLANTDDPNGYNPDTYLKADSAGALFLRLLVQENRKKVQEVAQKFHPAGSDKVCIDRALEAMDTDPMACTDPDKFIGIAQMLIHNKQYDEALTLLAYEDPDYPYTPKWPNHLGTALALAGIAEKKEDFEAVISLLTDKNGEARFPKHYEALRILTHGLNRTRQFERAIAIIQETGITDIKDSSLLQNCISALNNTGNYRIAVERFTTPEGLCLPCPPTPPILTNLGIALNACQEYRRTYYFMRDFLQHSAFRNNSGFLSVITDAANRLGLYRETINLLSKGEYGLHKNINCLRNLGYAYVFTGRLEDARQLVNFVRTRPQFDMSLVDGVVSALENAERTPDERRTLDVRQRFSPKSSKSIFAAGKLGDTGSGV